MVTLLHLLLNQKTRAVVELFSACALCWGFSVAKSLSAMTPITKRERESGCQQISSYEWTRVCVLKQSCRLTALSLFLYLWALLPTNASSETNVPETLARWTKMTCFYYSQRAKVRVWRFVVAFSRSHLLVYSVYRNISLLEPYSSPSDTSRYQAITNCQQESASEWIGQVIIDLRWG